MVAGAGGVDELSKDLCLVGKMNGVGGDVALEGRGFAAGWWVGCAGGMAADWGGWLGWMEVAGLSVL